MRSQSILSLLCIACTGWSQVNVAASVNGAVAAQSSTGFGGVASRANDGNRDGRYYGSNSVSHTNQELNAWWQSTFDSDYTIAQILVFNRTDSNLQGRLNPFRVELYDSLGSVVWSQSGITHTPDILEPDVEGMTLSVPDVLARRVRIQLDNHTNYLSLAEVEAYEPVPEPGTMLALGVGLLAALRKRRA